MKWESVHTNETITKNFFFFNKWKNPQNMKRSRDGGNAVRPVRSVHYSTKGSVSTETTWPVEHRLEMSDGNGVKAGCLHWFCRGQLNT